MTEQAKHTPGPLSFKKTITHSGVYREIWAESEGRKVAGHIYTDEDAERIVACWNACAGINPKAVPDLLEACKVQGGAIDLLFAMLIQAHPSFLPTKSGQPWEALLAGNTAIAKAAE